MNPYELMELKKESFTKNEMQIYQYMQENATDVFRGGIVQLAKETGVSQPTITRFCKKLGYENFGEFKLQLYRAKKSLDSHNQLGSAHDPMLISYQHLIGKIDQAIDGKQLLEVAKMIIEARRVYIIGIHKTWLSGELLRYNLIKFGIYCSTFNSDNKIEVFNLCDENDIVIIISANAENYRDFIKETHNMKTKVILITMNSRFHMKEINQCIWLPNHKNQGEKEFTENTVLFSIFVDILTSYIARIEKKSSKN